MRDVPREDIFELSASAAASKFFELVQVGLDVYIPHRKYQATPHSSPWFSAACAAAILHRNNFFCLYQQNKSSESKGNFRQASSCCKKILEAAKLAHATKTKESIKGPEVLSSGSNKTKLFAKNLSKNSNLDDSGISLPAFPSRTNLKLLNIFVTPNMVKRVIKNLDLSKASGPDCIPVMVLKHCEPELSQILAETCLKESCLLDFWKISSVVAIFNNVGEKSTAKNYRLVSLLLVVSKVFKKLVNDRIVDHPEKYGLLPDFQYGFRSSRSTADLLKVVSDRIARAFSRSGATRTCST